MGFADYFLIVWDFIAFAKRNGIGVGPGRGSAAGSLVAYCLEITDIDPIKYDLLFERFLNLGRKSMPDIDIDFSVFGRDQVINYVSEKYGRDRVAQIITFGTMMARAAIRDAGASARRPVRLRRPDREARARGAEGLPRGLHEERRRAAAGITTATSSSGRSSTWRRRSRGWFARTRSTPRASISTGRSRKSCRSSRRAPTRRS